VFVNPGRGEEGNQKEKVRVLIGNFELNPQGRPIWAWLELYLTPKLKDTT